MSVDPAGPPEDVIAALNRYIGMPGHFRLVTDQERDLEEEQAHLQKIASIIRAAGFPALNNAMYLASYGLDERADKGALAQAQQWLWAPAAPGLYLWGPVGTGKTVLAIALGREWILKHERDARFVVLLHLFQDLRVSFGRHEGSEAYEELLTVPLLILDDLGAEQGTEWELARLYELVNERLSRRRPTIYTSNLSIIDLERRLSRSDAFQGPRIAWRVKEHCWPHIIEMAGHNMRAEVEGT